VVLDTQVENSIRLKGVVMDDFCNYKRPSMFLISSFCDWKCCIEQKLPLTSCQNEPLHEYESKKFTYKSLYNAYKDNTITEAVVIGGLEPFIQDTEVYGLMKYFRSKGCKDKFVIYSGYTEDELKDNPLFLEMIKLGNLVIKFGRFVPNQKPHFDEVLGVNLISDNQYGKEY